MRKARFRRDVIYEGVDVAKRLGCDVAVVEQARDAGKIIGVPLADGGWGYRGDMVRWWLKGKDSPPRPKPIAPNLVRTSCKSCTLSFDNPAVPAGDGTYCGWCMEERKG